MTLEKAREKMPGANVASAPITEFCPHQEKGLTDEEAAASAAQHGNNRLTKKRHRGFFACFLQNFRDPIIKILLGALLLNTLLSLRDINWPESIGIASAVLMATLVSTISEAGSEKAFEKLSEKDGNALYTVRRNGTLRRIPLVDIVCGDILLISAGMLVPADGVLLSGHLETNQAALTGESENVIKKPGKWHASLTEESISNLSDPAFLFRGSTISSGEGEMMVLRVGDKTFYGRVAAELQEDSSPSPLKERLTKLAENVSFIGYLAAALVAFAYLFNSFVLSADFSFPLILEKLKDIRYVATELLGALTVAVSILVVAVPEGLPMMITVVLSSNMKRMLKSGVLVRKLVGIETSGSMNILFTDKTGTITTGNMRVISVITGEKTYSTLKQLEENKTAAEALKRCAFFCRFTGKNPNEEALLDFFGKPTAKNSKVTEKFPFDSAKRFAAAKIELGGKSEVLLRMAPELAFAAANTYVAADGCSRPLIPTVAERFKKEWRAAAADTCRILAVCKTSLCSTEEIKNGILHDLSLVALIKIRDEIREEVPLAVEEAHNAGIQVVMITGDNEVTAEAIARRCGIIHGRCKLVLTGGALQKLSDSAVLEILPELSVVARAAPGDKSRLVRLAKTAGLVCGMTGDGINDAPALKAADVGFAMGSGTDVAKEASDIIITNDNFASIVKAVLYGRTIFSSIRKFIVFQLIMNLSAVAVSLIGPLVGIEQPVTVIQMLWVNMIMDTLGGLAFAGEPPLRKYMKFSPIGREEPILTRSMIGEICFSAAYTVLLSLLFLKMPSLRNVFPGDDLHHLTAFFALFVFAGIFNSFVARTQRLNPLSHLAGNKPFLLIMTLVAAVQLALIYFGGETFRTVPLPTKELLFTALLAFTVIPVNSCGKLLTRQLNYAVIDKIPRSPL